MPGNFSVYRSWNTGDSLTASDLTNSFSHIINNLTPSGVDDYSTNAAQMQSTADPYPGSTESLATSMAGELERIRYVIKQITGQAQWYIDPPSSLSGAGGYKAFLTPESAIFPTTNFPQLVRNNGTNWSQYTLDFDQTTEEACFFRLSIPNGFTVSSANVEVYSYQAAATSGTVGWKITTITRADGEAWDTAGTTDTVTADAVEGTAGLVHKQTKSLTVTGWAADEILLIKVARDTANDTVAEDAKLMGVFLRLA